MLAAAAWLGCSGADPASDTRTSPPSVVLITLDTTRPDHLSVYGYARDTTPRLEALSRDAVVFDRAWSTSSWTLPAHASLFTGLYPATHGARFDFEGDAVLGTRVKMPTANFVRAGRLAEERATLAEILGARGYATGAFVAGPWLHRSFGLMQGFETVDDDVASFGGRPAQEITDRAIAWLEQLPEDEPFLLFVNYFDPHAPYRPEVGYDTYPRAREPEPPYGQLVATGRVDAATRERLVDRYDGEIRYMDHHLGRLLDAVAARHGPSDTMVIVTADHGEAFGEGGRVGHTYWLSEELLRVPLIIRYPEARDGGTRTDAPVQLVDILPTIVGELGLEPIPDAQGVPAGDRTTVYAELYREPTAIMRHGQAFDRDLEVAIEWPHKLTRSSRGEEVLVRVDAGDERPIEAPAVVKLLRERLDAQRQAIERNAPTAPSADPNAVEALRELGYIE